MHRGLRAGAEREIKAFVWVFDVSDCPETAQRTVRTTLLTHSRRAWASASAGVAMLSFNLPSHPCICSLAQGIVSLGYAACSLLLYDGHREWFCGGLDFGKGMESNGMG